MKVQGMNHKRHQRKMEPKVACETSKESTAETLSVLLCITLSFNIEYDLLAT